jgi:hypothetical protein
MFFVQNTQMLFYYECFVFTIDLGFHLNLIDQLPFYSILPLSNALEFGTDLSNTFSTQIVFNIENCQNLSHTDGAVRKNHAKNL